MSYKAKVGNKEFEVSKAGTNWAIANSQYDVQLNTKERAILKLFDTKTGDTKEAIIQKIDAEKKQVVLLLQQKEITVDLLEPIDQKMLALGIDIKKLSKSKNIKAPMPGLILKTLVKEGQHVKSGEPLFILEAMKMENVFKAPDDVEIKNILIKEGETVDKNQELIVFG